MIMTPLSKIYNKKLNLLSKISTPYTKYTSDHTHILLDSLVNKAKSLGADAVTDMHFKCDPDSFNASAHTFNVKVTGKAVKIAE